jgi:hypothetical protein
MPETVIDPDLSVMIHAGIDTYETALRTSIAAIKLAEKETGIAGDHVPHEWTRSLEVLQRCRQMAPRAAHSLGDEERAHMLAALKLYQEDYARVVAEHKNDLTLPAEALALYEQRLAAIAAASKGDVFRDAAEPSSLTEVRRQRRASVTHSTTRL